jgi:hypothetical protein
MARKTAVMPSRRLPTVQPLAMPNFTGRATVRGAWKQWNGAGGGLAGSVGASAEADRHHPFHTALPLRSPYAPPRAWLGRPDERRLREDDLVVRGRAVLTAAARRGRKTWVATRSTTPQSGPRAASGWTRCVHAPAPAPALVMPTLNLLKSISVPT